MKPRYVNSFGYDKHNGGHHFQVSIATEKSDPITILEVYTDIDPDLPIILGEHAKKRVTLSSDRWEQISLIVQYEFNTRSKSIGLKSYRWKTGNNKLSRIYGKEMVVLAWAIEDVDLTVIPTAIRNWLGLAPEERWWLYTQANATTGHAEKGRGKGWRKAIQIALTENPVGHDIELTKSAPTRRSNIYHAA